jgi:hypothetical protein
MKTALINEFRKFPDTLQKAYTMASNWTVDGKLASSVTPVHSSSGTDFTSKTLESSSSSSSTVFTTSEENGKKKGKKKKNNGANGSGSQQHQTANRQSEKDDGNAKQFQCFGCGSYNHSLQDCPDFIAFKAQRAQRSSVMTTVSNSGSRRNVRFSDSDDDDSFHLLCMTREVPCNNFQVPSKSNEKSAPKFPEDISVLPRGIIPRDPAVNGSSRVKHNRVQLDSSLGDKSDLLQEFPRCSVVSASSGVERRENSIPLDSFSNNGSVHQRDFPSDPIVLASSRVEPKSKVPLNSFSFIEDNCVLLRPFPSKDPVVSASSRVEPDNMCVLLDSQASVSVFREPLLLNSIRQSPLTKRVGGISSEAMVVNQIGDHPDFGTVYFNPHATANVLCQYDMAVTMGYKIELDVKAHSYKMSGTKTGLVYVFSEMNKLAVCACLPASQLLDIPESVSTTTNLQVAKVAENLEDIKTSVNSDFPPEKTDSVKFHKSIKKCLTTNGKVDKHFLKRKKLLQPIILNKRIRHGVKFSNLFFSKHRKKIIKFKMLMKEILKAKIVTASDQYDRALYSNVFSFPTDDISISSATIANTRSTENQFKESIIVGGNAVVPDLTVVKIKSPENLLKCSTGTKETDLVLEIMEILQVLRSYYADTSLGVHTDKGRTELVATSELLPQLIHCRDFLSAKRHEVSPTVQDISKLDHVLRTPLQGGIFRRPRADFLNVE